MTNNEIKHFIENNAQLIADKVNDYTAACNIKFSEFNEEQQRKLKVTLGAIEIQKLIS
tara:strand:- start:697 stop:870 length:174 start_codon:yes stop_codon:yes gene_type:complete